MSDNKTDEPAVPAADQHPLNSEHDETLVEAAETTTEQEKKEKEDTVEAPESHHADVAEKEAVVEERSDSHPLQEEEAPMAASYAYNTSDPWAQQESSLLDDQGQPNAAAASLHSTTPSPTPEQTQPLDPDTSHVKGFYNANDTNEILDLQVEGQLPEWLNGEHYTIGPGTYDIRYMRKIEIDGVLQSATATFTFGHWFDSLPMANRFDFNGKRNAITYRNRLTSRRLIEKVRDHHGYAPCHPGGLFKTDSNQTPLVKFLKSAPKASKPDGEPCAARILPNIPGVDGRLFAQNLANHIQELDPFDLKPTRLLCWNEINPAFKGYTSCPNGQIDPRTGEYINFTMEVGYQSTRYNFFSISDRNPKGSIIASVTAPTGYVQSFSVTPRYIILVVFPMLANTAGVKFAWNESILDSFSFYPNEPTLFYVISREKGQHIATYRSSACFAFHHVNAFEEAPDNIMVDIVCYKDDTIAHQLSTHCLRNPSEMKPSRLAPSEVRRYVLSNLDEESISFMASNSMMPSTASVTSRISSVWGYFRGTTNTNADVESSTSPATGWYANLPVASFTKIIQPSLELPQVNPLYSMYKYKYLYGLGFSATSSITDGKIWDSIVKADVDTRNIVATWHEDNCYPSEAVFIPRPAVSAEDELREDDGVLVSVVMDSARATSFLLVLDAVSLQVLAKANLETLIPLSFGRGSYRLRT